MTHPKNIPKQEFKTAFKFLLTLRPRRVIKKNKSIKLT